MKLSENHHVVYDTNIGAAREYNDEIAEMIDAATIVVSFISRNYVKSSYCIDEILYARGKEIPILLIYLEETEISSGMKMRLGRFQAVDIRDSFYLDKIFNIKKVKECLKNDELSSIPGTIEKMLFNTNEELDSVTYLMDIGEHKNFEATHKWKQQANWSLSALAGVEQTKLDEEKKLLELDLAKDGHYLITGIPQSGKSTFVQSMLLGLITKYAPSELHCYIVDFNNYMYECFSKAPHMGVVINDNSKRRIKYLMHLLESILEERKHIIKSGDIKQYNQLHGDKFPAVLLLIDNVEEFLKEMNQERMDILYRIVYTGVRYGVYLLLINNLFSSNYLYSEFPISKLTKYIKNRISFEQNSEPDYGEYFEIKNETVKPVLFSKWEPGKGIVKNGQDIKAFRAFLPCRADNIYVREQMIEMLCEDMRSVWDGTGAVELPDVPDVIEFSSFIKRADVQETLADTELLPVGLNVETGRLVTLQANQIFTFISIGKKWSEANSVLRIFLESALKGKAKIYYFDEEGKETLRLEGEDIYYANNAIELKELFEKSFFLEIEEQRIKKEKSDQMGHIFFFISNMSKFLKMFHSYSSEIFNQFLDIMEHSRNLNIHFIASIVSREIEGLKANPIWDMFVQEQQGIVIGQRIEEQRFLEYPNISYKEKGRKMNIGEGLICGNAESEIVKIAM